MDLSEIKLTEKSNDGAKMDLIHPVSGEILMDGDGNSMYIRVAGVYSDHYQKSSRSVMDRRLSKQKGRKKVNITAEQMENENTETIARCVIDWNILVNSVVPPCDFENVYKVLIDPQFRWIREQIEDFMEDDSNFT